MGSLEADKGGAGKPKISLSHEILEIVKATPWRTIWWVTPFVTLDFACVKKYYCSCPLAGVEKTCQEHVSGHGGSRLRSKKSHSSA